MAWSAKKQPENVTLEGGPWRGILYSEQILHSFYRLSFSLAFHLLIICVFSSIHL